MTRLKDVIGVEGELARIGGALRQFAQDLGAPVTGACHVMCADETELECAGAFQHWFVREIVPELKPDVRAPFRTVNLGGRYEWGSVRIAEDHFATAAAHQAFKLLVLKINAHTAVHLSANGPEYGYLQRYGRRSSCCGALSGLFGDSQLPAVEELRETLRSDGQDRVAVLGDSSVVPPRHRSLFTAVTSARLQAQRAVRDIQEYEPKSPTVFLVLPCVTINRPGPDTELVVGQYGVDRTGKVAEVKYRGLGDAPAKYRLRLDQGQATIEDDHWPGGE